MRPENQATHSKWRTMISNCKSLSQLSNCNVTKLKQEQESILKDWLDDKDLGGVLFGPSFDQETFQSYNKTDSCRLTES